VIAQFKKKKFHLEIVFTKHELGIYITPNLFTNFILSHASLTLTLSLLTPPPPSCLTPPSRLRLRLPHASHLLKPHLTSHHASLSLTSRLTPGDFKSTVLLLSLSSLGCAKRRQLSLSLWFGLCKFLVGEKEEAWFLLFIQISSILSRSSLPLSLSFESLLSLR
jgi:hypothetical protein